MILSIVLFVIGVFCYTIKELQSHGKLKGQKDDSSFWGERSWMRKWKTTNGKQLTMLQAVHTKKEAFPLSSTALVWLTDGYHLMQFFYIKLFILSIVLYSPVFTWYWDGAIYLVTWYLVFNAIYKVFSK